MLGFPPVTPTYGAFRPRNVDRSGGDAILVPWVSNGMTTKRRPIYQKHGVSFDEAKTVFTIRYMLISSIPIILTMSIATLSLGNRRAVAC